MKSQKLLMADTPPLKDVIDQTSEGIMINDTSPLSTAFQLRDTTFFSAKVVREYILQR